MLSKGCYGTVMERNQSCFVEFGLTYQQHALGPVDIIAVEFDGLAYTQPADCQQPDQGLIGGGPQRGCDRAACLAHQRFDIGWGVDKWAAPALPMRHQTKWWNLRACVDSGQIACETTGGRHPPRSHRRRLPGY